MKTLYSVLLSIFLVACGKGPTDAQLGYVDLSADKAVTFNGPSFEGATTAAANENVTPVLLGDEENTAEAAGNYTLDFSNSERKVKESYKAQNKVKFWVDEDGLRGLMKIGTVADAADAGTKAFACRLTRNTLGSEQPILERGTMLAKQALYIASNGKDLAVTTPTNVTMKLSCEPGVTSDVIDVDHSVEFANVLTGTCKVRQTRIETYTTDKDGNEMLTWKINSDCDVITVGDDVTFTGTTPPIDCKILGTCPPSTCQELGTCPVEPTLNCSDPAVCYISHDPVTISPYTGDLSSTLVVQHEVSGNDSPATTGAISGRVGQGVNYTRTGSASGVHYGEYFFESLGTLTAGTQQSFSFCWYSSIAQVLKMEVGQHTATYQYANLGVWLVINHPSGWLCRSVSYTVKGDPNKVPSTVTSFDNAILAYYIGSTANHTGIIDR